VQTYHCQPFIAACCAGCGGKISPKSWWRVTLAQVGGRCLPTHPGPSRQAATKGNAEAASDLELLVRGSGTRRRRLAPAFRAEDAANIAAARSRRWWMSSTVAHRHHWTASWRARQTRLRLGLGGFDIWTSRPRAGAAATAGWSISQRVPGELEVFYQNLSWRRSGPPATCAAGGRILQGIKAAAEPAGRVAWAAALSGTGAAPGNRK